VHLTSTVMLVDSEAMNIDIHKAVERSPYPMGTGAPVVSARIT